MTPFEEVTQFINDGLSVLKEAAPKKHREVFEVSLDQVFGVFKNLDTSYIAFEIPKKSGEMRQIEAPNRKLKWMQKGLKAQLETLFEAEPGAHGFVPERSIQSNAGVHVGQRYVLNLDIAGFFPSVKRGRVQTVLQLEPIGLSKPAARILAQFCTRNRALPQGAPTSPTLTNLVCMRLDRKLEKLARHYRCRYSRYADDITISGPSKDLMHHLLETHHQNPHNRGLQGARKQDPHPPDQPTARSHRPLRPRLCEFTSNLPPAPSRNAAHVAVQRHGNGHGGPPDYRQSAVHRRHPRTPTTRSTHQQHG